MEKYAIGKRSPEDISGDTVRFPWTPRTSGGEWHDQLLTPEGAKLAWDQLAASPVVSS